MTDIDDFVNRFIASWNEPDADRRAAVVEELFASDVRYCNASETFDGRDRGIVAVRQAYEEFVANGFVFAPLGEPSAHHDAITFRWQMTPADGGARAATGRMFAVLDPGGQIRLLYQFADPQPDQS